MKSTRGKIISIEGSDGTGKGTQTALLKESLTKLGYTVADYGFPRYKSENVGGRLLYHVLKSDDADSFAFSKVDPYAASLLYAMDRRESVPEINRLLEEYDFLIMDRYYASNLLHQGAKFENTDERNAFLDTMQNIEVHELKIPQADVIIYLTLPAEVSIARIEHRAKVTGIPMDQAERDHDYIHRSIKQGLEIATHLGWNIIQGVKFKDDGNTVAKEYSKEERQEMLLQLLRDKSFIKNS